MRAEGWQRMLVEAAAVAVASAVVALSVNALRPEGIPLVARSPYEVLVPCPEPGGDVVAIAADDPSLHEPRTFVIDARDAASFAAAHRAGAENVTYDWLDPIPEAAMKQLARRVAASGATRVVVYGDGARPDSGEHLGRELSGRGIRNVGYVEGGAPALLAEGERP